MSGGTGLPSMLWGLCQHHIGVDRSQLTGKGALLGEPSGEERKGTTWVSYDCKSD